MILTPQDLSYMKEVQEALRHAGLLQTWVVLVYPDLPTVAHLLQILALCAPAGATLSGRTAIPPNGRGRVSIAVVDQAVFVPKAQPFTVAFKCLDVAGKKEWREQAETVLS